MFQWEPPQKHVRVYEHIFNFFNICCISYVHIVSTFYIYPRIAIKCFIMELCIFFSIVSMFLGHTKMGSTRLVKCQEVMQIKCKSFPLTCPSALYSLNHKQTQNLLSLFLLSCVNSWSN